MMAKIAVLVSGGGTNLQALIDAQQRGELGGGESTAVIPYKNGIEGHIAQFHLSSSSRSKTSASFRGQASSTVCPPS